VRETVEFLRRVFAGERVVFEGETFTVQGFRLSRLPTAPIPIHVAALRPAMLRVAGQVGDGAIINWLSAEDVKKSVAVVREAAQKAGRDPEAVEITARIFVCIDPPSEATQTGIRRHINTYLNVPVYKAFHEWLGRTEALGPMWQAWESGDRKGAVAAIPESVIDELILRGSVDDIHAHVKRYMDAGVTTAFLQLQSFEKDPAVKRERLLKAVRDLAPGKN
jgi:alkanesulfonate monooxygenase SsuD/methylene tetrahydromethanopterin reductase-like flavin-dependent oxidoreductase (luciferase family)